MKVKYLFIMILFFDKFSKKFSSFSTKFGSLMKVKIWIPFVFVIFFLSIEENFEVLNGAKTFNESNSIAFISLFSKFHITLKGGGLIFLLLFLRIIWIKNFLVVGKNSNLVGDILTS